MKASDIPEKPILDFLAKLPRGHIGAGYHPANSYNLMDVVPAGTPEKVFLAKMRSLIKRGLVNGCCCGCRGDFTLPSAASEGESNG